MPRPRKKKTMRQLPPPRCDWETPQIRDPHNPPPPQYAERIERAGSGWRVKDEFRGGIPRRERERRK
jgi:hypothetical protein